MPLFAMRHWFEIDFPRTKYSFIECILFLSYIGHIVNSYDHHIFLHICPYDSYGTIYRNTYRNTKLIFLLCLVSLHTRSFSFFVLFSVRFPMQNVRCNIVHISLKKSSSIDGDGQYNTSSYTIPWAQPIHVEKIK